MDADEQFPALALIHFPTLAAQADIPQWIGTTPVDLQMLLDAAPTLYKQHLLPKKRSDGSRIVYALPRAEPIPRQLRAIQRVIARSIVAARAFPACVYGVADHPRRPSGERRSIVNNARQHLGQKEVLRCDLADFFDQVRIPQVCDVFTYLGARGAAVDCLTSLCTLDGRIPQGASSSPAIANVAARNLDDDLSRLALRLGCNYTRYIDDMVFSGEFVPDVDEISARVIGNGFALNADKTRRQRRGRSQYVTGLNVADAGRPHIPVSLKRRLRSALRLAAKVGFKAGTRDQLKGMLWYVLAADQGVVRRRDTGGEIVPTFGDRMLELFQEADTFVQDQGNASIGK
jgi:RNA-directed DNA polymerase